MNSTQDTLNLAKLYVQALERISYLEYTNSELTRQLNKLKANQTQDTNKE